MNPVLPPLTCNPLHRAWRPAAALALLLPLLPACGSGTAEAEAGAPRSAAAGSDGLALRVQGEDLRLAAAVSERLNAGGLSRVWLVTP